ncbi:hypothetical protein [Leptospira adleri]|uniref:hypothetical protein n=1 Tax=Leptospira adleri TaxID=2023186 RepID=UPI00108375F4|nr:hypothetical protein [Leptospira adleri]TGM53244.1 hypothetical protein EHQ97_15245 [Leptospira adleri]
MKSNIMKLAAIAAFMVVLSACKPKDKDDNTTIGALVLLLDQTSGNCATTFKLSSTSYFVSASVVPKGGCNKATLYGSDLASYIVLTNANTDLAITAATALNCSAAFITALTNSKTTTSATTQATYDTQVAAYQFSSIGDLRVEAGLALTTAYTALGVTAADIATWKLASLDQYKTSVVLSTIKQKAGLAGDAACATAAQNKLNTDFKGFVGLDNTVTSKASYTTIASASCTYGSATAANTACATINTQY